MEQKNNPALAVYWRPDSCSRESRLANRAATWVSPSFLRQRIRCMDASHSQCAERAGHWHVQARYQRQGLHSGNSSEPARRKPHSGLGAGCARGRPAEAEHFPATSRKGIHQCCGHKHPRPSRNPRTPSSPSFGPWVTAVTGGLAEKGLWGFCLLLLFFAVTILVFRNLARGKKKRAVQPPLSKCQS